jgi:hypothetical protein
MGFNSALKGLTAEVKYYFQHKTYWKLWKRLVVELSPCMRFADATSCRWTAYFVLLFHCVLNSVNNNTWNVSIKVKFRRVYVTNFTRNKQLLNILCVSVALVTQNAISMHHLWPVQLYNNLPHYFIKGTLFGKKKLPNTECVFWFSLQLLFETFLILRRTEPDIIRNVHS